MSPIGDRWSTAPTADATPAAPCTACTRGFLPGAGRPPERIAPAIDQRAAAILRRGDAPGPVADGRRDGGTAGGAQATGAARRARRCQVSTSPSSIASIVNAEITAPARRLSGR